MNYYEPQLTLTETNPASNTWKLKTTILYPAGETGTPVSNQLVGPLREIEVDVQLNPMFKHDHSVTSTKTYQRAAGETAVEVTVKKDGKKKGTSIIVYTGHGEMAA
ncbi:MAG: hypothetical protein ACPGWM_06195 [Flavobacteriales bacterium]